MINTISYNKIKYFALEFGLIIIEIIVLIKYSYYISNSTNNLFQIYRLMPLYLGIRYIYFSMITVMFHRWCNNNGLDEWLKENFRFIFDYFINGDIRGAVYGFLKGCGFILLQFGIDYIFPYSTHF